MTRDYRNEKASQFFADITENPANFPIHFTYDGKEYCGFSDDDIKSDITLSFTEGDRETTAISFILRDTLSLYLKVSHYKSHGAIEWTLEFENISDRDSAVISDVKSVLSFNGENPRLCGILGDHENYYAEYTEDLSRENKSFTSDSGRATHINFPYFNLEYGNGGALLAIGWAGTWNADFSYDGSTVTYTAKSVNNLCTYLKPSERIRTALFVVIPYTDRRCGYATNLWRSWYIKYNLPKADAAGNDLKPFSTCCLASDTGLQNSDGSISERYFTWRPSLEKMIAEDAKVDFRWFDAGWYITPDKKSAEPYVKGRDWWDTVGTWELDPIKWPNDTFLESTEYAREHDMKTLVWFEPERVTEPENLAKNFGYNTDWAIRMEGTNVISNNIGNPDCFKWITDRICNMLRHNKVEMYREDNNGDPAKLWDFMDKKEGIGRSGITECKFIDAHYRMWDIFIDCTLGHGGCGFVDSCASGGGRNDLESMRRGVPLLRSDLDRKTTAIRLSMTSTFNKWIPFCGANSKEKASQLAATGNSDTYIWRASYLPALNVDSQFVQDPDQDFDILRSGLREWKEINPYLLCEFYTLTPYHGIEDTSGFTAYTYFNPETEKGVLFVFRQEECEESNISLAFDFTDNRELILTDKDTGDILHTDKCKLELVLPEKRTAKLYFYNLKN